MMVFTLTAMSPQGQWHHFRLQHHDLETVYGVLHTIAQQGDTLLDVSLVDKHGYLPLPLEVFQQELFSNPIQELRQQWEALLAQPVRSYSSKAAFAQRLDELRQVRITSIRRAISRIQALVERTKPYTQEGPRQEGLLAHYQHLLDRYSRYLVRLETSTTRQRLLSS